MSVFAVIGAIVALAVCVTGAVLAVMWAAQTIHERIYKRALADATRQVGNGIVGASWWFSEDKATMDVVRAIGDWYLSASCYAHVADVDGIREKWRTARATPEPRP